MRQHEPRITPAYAGKSQPYTPQVYATGDHPRVRGEKGVVQSGRQTYKGSPPRTRGKAVLIPENLRKDGITPAYAGKRWRPLPPGKCCWDHPRVRGEKGNAGRRPHAVQGSPPRTRGKAFSMLITRGFTGITPAYAGKSPRRWLWTRPARDHPRVRGEKDAGSSTA